MDNVHDENNHDCDEPQQKRRPAPIVSLGKIIGYKLACFGVSIKTMDVFNSPPLRKLLFKMEGRKVRKTDKKPKDKKVKRSVSFSDIVQEKTIEEMTDDRHDTNVNASQGKGSDTNISNLRKAMNSRHFSYQQKSPITKSCHKAAPMGKIKGTSCLKQRNAKLKAKTDISNDLHSVSDQKSVIRTRSTSALTNECPSVSSASEQPSNKSSETFIVGLSDKHKKKTIRNRRAEMLKGDTSKTYDEKAPSKGGKTFRKTRNMDWTMRKRNYRFDPDKLHDLPSSSRKCSLVPFKSTPKTKPLPTVSHKSPLKTACKKASCNRRWADVVAGTSRNIDNLIQSQSNVMKSREVQETDTVGDGNSFSDESTPSKENDTACPKMSRRSSRIHENENTTSAESSHEPSNTDQDPNVKDGAASSYQDNFPSLQELKSKNQKRAKWCQRQKDENQDNCIKTAGKQRRRRIRRDRGSNNISKRSKRRKRKKQNKKAKRQNKVMTNLDNTKGEISQAVVSKTDSSPKDSSYIIGNIQEVVIQPAGNVCPLTEETDTLHGSNNGETNHFTLVTLSPHRDNTRNDICSKLDAMSVTGNLECAGPSNPDGIAATKGDLSKGEKSPRLRIQKNQSKCKLDEPGPSQKKTSARYRALLRRDHGKVDAKRATEIFNCGRWVDLHQREKIYDRFDVHQQRRNQRRMNNSNDPTDVSQLLNTCNTLYYCVPQENNECPIM